MLLLFLFRASSHLFHSLLSNNHHGGCLRRTTRLLTALLPLSADTQCKTSAKADIVLLVDGSWSIGRINFKTIRNFIARMVSVFDIGPDRVQIGNVTDPS